MAGKFKKTPAAPTGEAVIRALALDYLAVQEEFKGLELRKKEISKALEAAMADLGEEKFRVEDVGSVAVVCTTRTTYSRDSVAEALVAVRVPEKYHVALLDAAGKVGESRYVKVTAFKEKAED